MRLWKKIVLGAVLLAVLFAGAVFGISAHMVSSTGEQILCRMQDREQALSQEELDSLREKGADCILVLGAKVKKDGSPSYMLKDRLDLAISLYKAGAAPKLLLSGDHGQVRYDEVNAMKQYAMERGVPKEDLFLDHAGFSTYDSVYRAKEIFQAERIIVVTQSYHQYRALYGCGKMGIKAWGVASDQAIYRGQNMRDLREIAARDKDFFKWMAKPDPTYLGEAIPISGSGIASQD
ncbi:MAG: DUF218 domain-containing protein [Firmicutes bacterium]|nr:DUF218 domain-containing protein [Bacillota bacterium]